MSNIDPTDKRILQMLQENADYTNKEIASRLGMSVTPIFERIRKLKNNGTIQRVIAIVDKKALGKTLTAYCNVSLKEHAKDFLEKFEREVAQLSEVQECYHIAGHYDYMLKVNTKDIENYQLFITKKLAGLENIGNVKSSFVMKEIKHSYVIEAED
ncbi:MAG: Lrp/AsnC family transcriptional regulator [Saprospiraceae bacterium]|nr:Lrp/AsnC family transcriptional regulator [Saprospiraceae bacterium]MCB9322315.1 Lrp/AsnC family transcriptional regulator [Lewinellaceae bacterium]